jgi:hypothetical protein
MFTAISAKRSRPQAIRALLVGENTISAPGVATCTAAAPVFELCRLLIKNGADPATPLVIYRCETLCLRVRCIGEGAGLQINGKGSGFIKAAAPVCKRSDVRQTDEPQAADTPVPNSGGAS